MIFDAKNSRWVKGGRSKISFLNVSGIGRAPTSLIVFFSKTGKSVRAGTKRPQMLRKPRFNMSQPSFSTSMFLKNSERTRERESEYMCVSNEPLNTGLVN